MQALAEGRTDEVRIVVATSAPVVEDDVDDLVLELVLDVTALTVESVFGT